MALTTSPNHSFSQINKLPLHTYIDALRWLPQLSAFNRHVLLAAYDADTSTSSLKTLNFSPSQNTLSLALQASVPAPSRISSLKIAQAPLTSSKPLIAAATFSGSVIFYSADFVDGSLSLEFSAPEKGFHTGAVAGIDLSEDGSECVSVGEDGRVNLVNLSEKGGFRRVFDSHGLVSYSSVRWASPVEFVTGSFGFGLQWWDQRKDGGPVALFKNNWTRETDSGIVHSIDIHPSRKHTCLAGGSSGVVFAWDTRWPKQPVVLSRAGTENSSLVESDIWQVQYDNYTHPSKIINSSSSSSLLPAMICSEDGILALINQGEETVELLAEPCAINSFDIDRQNPSFGVGINSHLKETIMGWGKLKNCIHPSIFS